MSWCHIFHITSVILYIYNGYVTASEYYVSAAPNGESCPSTDLPCRNLSYYIAHYSSYFTDNAIFYFLEGTHTLQGILNISNVSNITLQGQGHIEQGFHETVMQSTSVIRCSNKHRTGIQCTSSTEVVLEMLTIANCGFTWYQHYIGSLYFVGVNTVILECVSVQNGSSYGLVFQNTHDMLIANSSFTNNGDLVTFSGNVLILHGYPLKTQPQVKIVKSNFTLGSGNGMFLLSRFNIKPNIIIDNSMFSNNIAQYGGGVNIFLLGGGRIEFSSCTISNNTAQYGGGIHIGLNGKSSIHLSDSTICNNVALNGGGVYIQSYGDGNIDVSNCNIYNNTVEVNGGGVMMYLLGDGNIEFIECTIYDNTAQSDGGGIYIISYAESGSNEFSNCTISNNSAYFTSGLVLHSLQSTSTSAFHFTNVSFHFNKIFNRPVAQQNGYQSAITLLNVDNVTFHQLKVSNHNTTGLLVDNSLITFDGHNMFVNNSGIYGGGIALFYSSKLLLNVNANMSFVNNHASKSGGGIFVYHDHILSKDIATDCSFRVIPYHYPNDTKTVLYFVNSTADISGDVLYGGKINDSKNILYFDHLFQYPQQTGLSVVSSDPIKVCFCETNRQICSITNISIFSSPGIDINVSLATVGILDGLTQGVIKLKSSDNSSIVQYHKNRLNAVCTNITFTLRANSSLKTIQIYATLKSSINEPLYDPYAKVIEVNIEPCPNGFPLVNDTCVCRPELNTPSITCDINSQIITRDGDMWIGYENDSDCLIVYPRCPFNYCDKSKITFTLNYPSKQCFPNRSGILCGQCAKGFSLMLGSNQCEQCTDENIALIISFALAGIALVVFVIVLNLTILC